MLGIFNSIAKFISNDGISVMKQLFDLNNLTDEEALYIENALATRRILKQHSNMIPIIDRGYNTCDIQLFCAANHDIPRTVFAQSRQSGKSGSLWEQIANFKPYLEFEYTPEIVDQIDESHEQYNTLFNQFRRMKYLPCIELKIGSKYEIQLGENIKHLYLTRIDGDIKCTPELYFSAYPQPKTGQNISVYKILREVKKETK